MKRMTTDNPQLNIERLLNTARAENNQAVLHLGDEIITLAEYIAKCAKEYGCDVTQESVMDGDNCVECDCPVAILNILGIQAAENNARLKMIEKILGGDYDLDRLRELVQADHEGRYIIMRDAERNGVARLKELSEADREGRCVIAEKPPESGNKYVLQTVQGCWINGDVTILKQSALKAMKENSYEKDN